MGADERLLQHRTTPVTVDLWVDNILLDVLDHPDIYDDAYDELDRREDEVPAPDNVDATPPPGFEWLDERDEHGLPAWLDDPEKVSAFPCLAKTTAALTTPSPRRSLQHRGPQRFPARR